MDQGGNDGKSRIIDGEAAFWNFFRFFNNTSESPVAVLRSICVDNANFVLLVSNVQAEEQHTTPLVENQSGSGSDSGSTTSDLHEFVSKSETNPEFKDIDVGKEKIASTDSNEDSNEEKGSSGDKDKPKELVSIEAKEDKLGRQDFESVEEERKQGLVYKLRHYLFNELIEALIGIDSDSSSLNEPKSKPLPSNNSESIPDSKDVDDDVNVDVDKEGKSPVDSSEDSNEKKESVNEIKSKKILNIEAKDQLDEERFVGVDDEIKHGLQYKLRSYFFKSKEPSPLVEVKRASEVNVDKENKFSTDGNDEAKEKTDLTSAEKVKSTEPVSIATEENKLDRENFVSVEEERKQGLVYKLRHFFFKEEQTSPLVDVLIGSDSDSSSSRPKELKSIPVSSNNTESNPESNDVDAGINKEEKSSADSNEDSSKEKADKEKPKNSLSIKTKDQLDQESFGAVEDEKKQGLRQKLIRFFLERKQTSALVEIQRGSDNDSGILNDLKSTPLSSNITKPKSESKDVDADIKKEEKSTGDSNKNSNRSESNLESKDKVVDKKMKLSANSNKDSNVEEGKKQGLRYRLRYYFLKKEQTSPLHEVQRGGDSGSLNDLKSTPLSSNDSQSKPESNNVDADIAREEKSSAGRKKNSNSSVSNLESKDISVGKKEISSADSSGGSYEKKEDKNKERVIGGTKADEFAKENFLWAEDEKKKERLKKLRQFLLEKQQTSPLVEVKRGSESDSSSLKKIESNPESNEGNPENGLDEREEESPVYSNKDSNGETESAADEDKTLESENIEPEDDDEIDLDSFVWVEEDKKQGLRYKLRRYFLDKPEPPEADSSSSIAERILQKYGGNAFKHGFIDFISGSVGGIVQVIVSHPFDTVKVKQQLYPKLYSNMLQCFVKTYSKDGLTRGLYAGCVPATVASIAENSVIFTCYGRCQSAVASIMDIDNAQKLSVLGNACAGSMAAFVSSLTLCPTELVKCKLQAIQEIKPYVAKGSKVRPITPYHMTKEILEKEGIGGFYRGLTSTFAREIPGFFFFFGSYEATREFLKKEDESKDDIGPWKTMIAGSVGGITLWTSTFPADVIKSRIQIQNLKTPMLTVAADIIRKEGIGALYNGLMTSIVRTIPATATLFLVYENSKKLMNKLL